jgi:hypothetical protein
MERWRGLKAFESVGELAAGEWMAGHVIVEAAGISF